MKKILIIILVVIGVLLISYIKFNRTIANGSLSMNEKIKDFEYMYNLLLENYPYFEVNKRVNGIDWPNKKNEYIDAIRTTKSDEEYQIVLDSILKDLNSKHVNLLDKDFYSSLSELYNTYPDILKPWCDILNNNKAVERYSKIEESNLESKNFNSNLDDSSDNIITEIIVPEEIAYLYIKSFNGLNIKQDYQYIYDFLYKTKDYPNLIIDIRGNGGGAMSYWHENLVSPLISKEISYSDYFLIRDYKYTASFLDAKNVELYNFNQLEYDLIRNSSSEVSNNFKYFAKENYTIYPKNEVGFKGDIFLIVDNLVYSAADNFASFSKKTNWATVVGENTSGGGIGIDPALILLPNSGYIVRFPIEYGLNSDGLSNEEHGTIPDINITSSSEDENSFIIQELIRIIKKY